MDTKTLKAHWQDEGESAYIYKSLAQLEKDEQRRKIYERLADAELKHQATFLKLLEERGEHVDPWRPGLRIRLLEWMARRGNSRMVLNLRVADESREVRNYPREGRADASAEIGNSLRSIARDEANHAGVLTELKGSHGEPWHHSGSGGFLRNVIYGFNDGLTANFGLVMGVLGANVSSDILLLSGISGLVADALSMGGSGFLAAKSEQEVWEHEIAMEREEMELMPEIEQEELALLYEAKGMPAAAAATAAAQVMADPKIALQEKTREELGITGEAASPMREAVTTGVSTAVGAFIPVLPFLFGSGAVAVWTSFSISMLAHFVVGAARSVFTGRGVFRSGIDMFLVGLGVAAVGFLVGALITGHM
jgi:vacuolar iron transporter family protein